MKIQVQQPIVYGTLIPINFKDGSIYYPDCWHLNDTWVRESLDFEGERMYTDIHCSDCGKFIETLKVEWV